MDPGGYNPITNPIPNVNQNPYIEKQRKQVLSGPKTMFSSVAANNIFA
jgi:hypothetical protein